MVAATAKQALERGSRGRRRQRPSGDDRERAILDTAELLLRERSLQEISVDELARGAGISRPTFYFYFASKEAVVLTLLDRLVAEARAGIELGRLAEDPRDVLRRALSSVHETFREHRAVALAATEMRAGSAAVRELWADVMEGFVEQATAAIEGERRRGAAPGGPPARDLAIALNLMNERVIQATLSGEGPSIADERLLESLLEVWMRAIYGAGESSAR